MSDAQPRRRVLAAVVQRLATPASIRAIFYEALGRRPGFAHPPGDELAVLLELCGFHDVRGRSSYALLSRCVPRVQTARTFAGLAQQLRRVAKECLVQLSQPMHADACDESDGWGDWDGEATAPGAAVAVAQRRAELEHAAVVRASLAAAERAQQQAGARRGASVHAQPAPSTGREHFQDARDPLPAAAPPARCPTPSPRGSPVTAPSRSTVSPPRRALAAAAADPWEEKRRAQADHAEKMAAMQRYAKRTARRATGRDP